MQGAVRQALEPNSVKHKRYGQDRLDLQETMQGIRTVRVKLILHASRTYLVHSTNPVKQVVLIFVEMRNDRR